MTDRELMQQALEVAETAQDDLREAVDEYIARYGENWRPIRLRALRDDLAKCEATITALRERLAQPSPDEVIASHAKRLALELEGVLLECHDTSATSKWWNSAYQAIHNFHDDINWLYPQDHVSPLGKD